MTNLPLPSPPIPRQAVPSLQVPTLGHGDFSLAEDAAENFTLVVFYRGLHCPICLKYLLELGRLQPDFARRGVKVVALSSDGRERAQAMADKLKAPDLRLGYDLGLATARAQTMPFARPHVDELLAALDFALQKNYPARGEYVGVV